MTKQKRSIWDDLVELGRDILDRIDNTMNPEQRPQREPVRVPVPIRNPHPRRESAPYDDRR